MRKPEGIIGASSENEASMGAKMSSAQFPTAFSSTPLQSWGKMHPTKILISIKEKQKPFNTQAHGEALLFFD